MWPRGRLCCRQRVAVSRCRGVVVVAGVVRGDSLAFLQQHAGEARARIGAVFFVLTSRSFRAVGIAWCTRRRAAGVDIWTNGRARARGRRAPGTRRRSGGLASRATKQNVALRRSAVLPGCSDRGAPAKESVVTRAAGHGPQSTLGRGAAEVDDYEEQLKELIGKIQASLENELPNLTGKARMDVRVPYTKHCPRRERVGWRLKRARMGRCAGRAGRAARFAEMQLHQGADRPGAPNLPKPQGRAP